MKGHTMNRKCRASTPSVLVSLIAAVLWLSSCSGSDANKETKSEPAGEPLSMVALGDSIALDGPECDGCTSFVDLSAKQLSEQMGRKVTASNHAIPDAEATDVLSQVRDDEITRSDITGASVVVVELGINDSPWNRKDDPCRAAPKYPVVRWSRITTACVDRVASQYRKRLKAILDEIDSLRSGQPTALRLVNVYNAVLGDKVDPSWNSAAAKEPSMRANAQFAQIQCEAVQDHDGTCIDAFHAFNGKDGAKPADAYLAADHTHPNATGHTIIADLLVKAGTKPLT
jgi:lysophospholipase L1-like esterase